MTTATQALINRFRQFKRTLKDKCSPYDTVIVMRALIPEVIIYLKEKDQMDKKMAKVTKKIVTAGKDIQKGREKKALKDLKEAKKKNVKLTKIDREVRDPKLKACDKVMHKMKKK